ncbi:MAG: hypothetical protein U0798_03375 [Gemmataceae bacterium]
MALPKSFAKGCWLLTLVVDSVHRIGDAIHEGCTVDVRTMSTISSTISFSQRQS